MGIATQESHGHSAGNGTENRYTSGRIAKTAESALIGTPLKEGCDGMSDREKVINEQQRQIEEVEERIAIMTETTTPDYDGQNIYCNECRTLIASTDKFCRNCGREVKWE